MGGLKFERVFRSGPGMAIWALQVFAAVVGAPAAQAGSCGDQAAALRSSIEQNPGPDSPIVATAPQTIDAQLEHQPTPASVARAKRTANLRISALLEQAQRLDDVGNQTECEQALATAKRLLNP